MKSFLGEVKRRNVARAAIAYAIVGWLLVEIASTVLPTFDTPDWVLKAFTFLVVLGFPLVLLFAWAFELTPEGLKRTHEVPAEQSVTPSTGRKLDFVIIGVLVIAVTYISVTHDWSDEGISSDQISTAGSAQQSIAVLPFANMSSDEENEYFSDGLSETLLHMLAQIKDLRVAARTSSFQFKGHAGDVADIGKQLKVATILEGSVRKAGDTIRVTAQLINVDDGYHLWSGTYDRKLEDIFAIQDEIATQVVDALKVTLLDDEAERLSQPATENVDAYNLYLLGRHLFHQRTEETLLKAKDYFKQAITTAPEYALAHTGLADTYMLLEDSASSYGSLSSEVVREQAGAAIERALELDPGLAEAHASKGLLFLHDNQTEIARQWLSSAMELNPNYPMAHMWTGLIERQSGRFDLSELAFRDTVELDPMSVVARSNLAYDLFVMGKMDDFSAQWSTIQSLAPNAPLILTSAGYRSYMRGELVDAAASFEQSLHRNAVYRLTRNFYGRIWLDLGNYERASEYLSDGSPWLLLAQGQFDRLVESAKESVEANPNDPSQQARLATAYLYAGALEQARLAFEAVDAKSTSRHDALFRGYAIYFQPLAALERAYLYSLLGDAERSAALVEESRSFLSQMRKQGINLPFMDYHEATAAAILAQSDQAIELLERAIAGGFRSGWLLEMDPKLASIRGDPGFLQLLEDLNAINDEIRGQLLAESVQ